MGKIPNCFFFFLLFLVFFSTVRVLHEFLIAVSKKISREKVSSVRMKVSDSEFSRDEVCLFFFVYIYDIMKKSFRHNI